MARWFLLGALVALVVPAAASAHAGRSAPVATNFRTTPAVLPSTTALEVKVADGDRLLWLRASDAVVVTVLGTVREPFLRFDHRGVSVNLRSSTARIDGITPPNAPVRTGSTVPPRWHRVRGGHTYTWHDHRLHALEPLARGRGAETLGRWAIPALVDGRRVTIGGELRYVAPSSPWPWVMAIVLLAAGGILARRRALVVTGLALVATVAIAVARIGRELYGRPSVGGLSYAGIALTCLVGALLAYGLTRRDDEIRAFVAFIVGFGSLYQGLTFLPMLTHALPLTVLPAPLARACIVVMLGAGGAALGVGALEQARAARAPRRRHRTAASRSVHPLPKQR